MQKSTIQITTWDNYVIVGIEYRCSSQNLNPKSSDPYLSTLKESLLLLENTIWAGTKGQLI